MSGLAVAFAFPHFDVWPLAWAGWVPLLFVIQGRSIRATFLLALLAGGTANFVGFFWMTNMLNDFGHLPFPLSAVIVLGGAFYQGLSHALAFTLANWIVSKKGWHVTFVLPLFFTALEAVHPILFPWFLGNCQYQLLRLIQICDIAGISSVTFVVMMGNAALYEAARGVYSRSYRFVVPAAAFLLLLAACLCYGHFRLEQFRKLEAGAEKLRIAVLEPEIGIFEEQATHFPKDDPPLWILKWNLIDVHRATQKLAAEKPDLVVWPESTYFPALSVYAKDAQIDWLATGTRGVQRIRPDFRLGEETGSGGYNGLFSRGPGRGYAVGDEGRILHLDNKGAQSPLPDNSGVTVNLQSVWVGCSNEYPFEDTPMAACVPMAAGEDGTLLVLLDSESNHEWRRIDTGVDADLYAVSGFGSDSYVAAGDGVILFGSVHGPPTAVKKTPGRRWFKSVTSLKQVVLLDEHGHLASVSPEGEITLPESHLALDGRVADAALAEEGSLLIATETGLVSYVRGNATNAAAGQPFRAVACNDAGRCVALDDSGRLYTVDGIELTEVALLPPDIHTLAAVPFVRHYYWLPPDAQMLYQARRPLPKSESYPLAIIEDQEIPVRDVNAVQRGFALPLLFGATSGVLNDFEDPNSLENTRYNSAFLLDEEGRILGRYDKQYLLAFGEYIPMGDLLPFLYEWSPASGRFEAGPNRAPLMFKGHSLGILVCYEDIIPSHTNLIAAQGANVLINLTNDAWFGKTREPHQHFVLALFRAIEQRLPLVRATTTGISGMVSSTGEIRRMTDLYDAETFTVDVPMLSSDTIYRQFGRHFHLLLLLIGALLVVWSICSRNGQKRSAT